MSLSWSRYQVVVVNRSATKARLDLLVRNPAALRRYNETGRAWTHGVGASGMARRPRSVHLQDINARQKPSGLQVSPAYRLDVTQRLSGQF